MKAYKLTPENLQLSNFFEGLVIDEENSLLWSEQDLSTLGCEEVVFKEKNKICFLAHQLQNACSLGIFFFIAAIFWCVIRVLAILPSRKLKDLSVMAEARFGGWHSGF